VIQSWEGAEVIVPNGQLVSDSVTNWTLSDRRRRVEVNVGVEYGTDAQRVLDLLLEVARGHPALRAEPEPRALFLGFGDSSLDFQLRVWTDRMDRWMVTRSELVFAIHAKLREKGIEIPFPQRDLHIRTPLSQLRES
jgi:small-conductance mechanosensitive channel